jgi:predicted  nucleic acid-binding Zn-ribbon protein
MSLPRSEIALLTEQLRSSASELAAKASALEQARGEGEAKERDLVTTRIEVTRLATEVKTLTGERLAQVRF